MEVISFELSGKFAFFKKNENTRKLLLTYSHIHKVALMGLLGAITGLNGHRQRNRNNAQYPEFYEKLKNIRVAVIPFSKNNEESFDGVFDVIKVETNNTTGVSKEDGGNYRLIQQMLFNPAWRIILDISKLDENMQNKLKYSLLNKQYRYIPYFGRRENFAYINNVEILEANLLEKDTTIKVNGLFHENNQKPKISLFLNNNDDFEYKYEHRETLPVSYINDEKCSCYYKEDIFVLTNNNVTINSSCNNFYEINNEVYYFY